MQSDIDRLWTFSRGWAAYRADGVVSNQLQAKFIDAFLHNGEVTRRSADLSEPPDGLGKEMALHNNSTRKTTKARDLVLSIMPQYSWYTPPTPQQVRDMTFGALFEDCFSQARLAHQAVMPRIANGMVGGTTLSLETSNVPMPEYLGDFAKLFGMSSSAAPSTRTDCALGFDFGPIQIGHIDLNNTEFVLGVLKKSFEFSRHAWRWAQRGEMSRFDCWPDAKLFSSEDPVLCFENTMKFLNLAVLGITGGGGAQMDALSFERDLIKADSWYRNDILIRTAALISCGIGISALEWTQETLVPVLVHIGSHNLLSMMSLSEAQTPSFWDKGRYLEAHLISNTFTPSFKHNLIVTAGKFGDSYYHRCVGLLPDFFDEGEDSSVSRERYGELGILEKLDGLMESVHII